LPAALPTNRITVSLRTPIFRSLAEMAQAASFGALDLFVAQLIEASVASFRCSKVSTRAPLAPKSESPMEHRMKHGDGSPGRTARLSPEKIQQARFLFETEGLTTAALSKRFGVSRSVAYRWVQTWTRSEPVKNKRSHHRDTRGAAISVSSRSPWFEPKPVDPFSTTPVVNRHPNLTLGFTLPGSTQRKSDGADEKSKS
jgi:transposase-like protein